MPPIALLNPGERRIALPWASRRTESCEQQLDRLRSSEFEVVSLARLRARLRGLDEPDRARPLLLCIDAESPARDRLVELLAARSLPALYFADGGDAAANSAGHWTALRELAPRGISVEMRGRTEWELGRATTEHTFASMLRVRGELERRIGRAPSIYRFASARPAAALHELLERLGFELCAGRPSSGADLELHPLRELLASRARKHSIGDAF